MDIELIEKLNGFNHLKFEEARHLYFHGNDKLESITTLIKRFESDKDWEEIAFNYAAKNGESPEYWREKWRQEGLLAREKGSEFHLYAENAMANKIYIPDRDKLLKIQKECELVDKDIIKSLKKMMMMWDVFWIQAKGSLIPVKSEFIVGDLDYGKAGMLDQLFYNTKAQELQIWDWKSNKEIKKSNRYQNFKSPIGHLEECDYIKYSLQTGSYKHFIQKNLGIELGSSYIGHFTENNDTYKILKCRELDEEVKLILNS